MSNIKKKAATEAESVPAGPYEKVVREAADLLGWRVRHMPSLLVEPGYICVTDPVHKLTMSVAIDRGEACDDSLWKVLCQNTSLLHAQAQRSEEYPG